MKQPLYLERLDFLKDRWKSFSPHTIAIMLKSSFAIFCLALFIRLTFSVTHRASVQTFE